MGGKSYFCDYCRCFMKNDVNVRKTHNEGMLHKMLKVRYMRKYEDPRKVYDEEIAKAPCPHFLKGRCRYDFLCQSSHFNPEQLKELRQIVDKLCKRKPKLNTQPNLNTQTKSGTRTITHLLSWNPAGDIRSPRQRIRKAIKYLPPSVRPLNVKKLTKNLGSHNTWGEC